jgi:predicted nuclease of predicted toxin-antitoxin system
MRTLSSELAPYAGGMEAPRVYADANVPAGVVAFMRERLRWDVLFVVEHDDLRRAHDLEHFRLARQLARTLVTLDRDFLDDRRFPPGESAGIVVVWAPNERLLQQVLQRLDERVFHGCPDPGARNGTDELGLPLAGRKMMADPDWTS